MKKKVRLGVIGVSGRGRGLLGLLLEMDDVEIVGISAAGHNLDVLEEQVRKFRPNLAAVYDEDAARDFAVRIADTGCRVCAGMDGLIEVAAMEESDLLVTAIVGMIGIRPTIAAIRAGKGNTSDGRTSDHTARKRIRRADPSG